MTYINVVPPLKPAYGLEWSDRVRRYKDTHPKRCAACGDKRGCRLHHMTYKRLAPIADQPGLGRSGGELDSELRWLCDPGCHERVHHWHDRIFPNDRLPYHRLAIVTVVYIACVQVRRRVTPAVTYLAGTVVAWRIGWWVALLVLAAVLVARRTFIKPTHAVTYPRR